jgi:hypothetical protein
VKLVAGLANPILPTLHSRDKDGMLRSLAFVSNSTTTPLFIVLMQMLLCGNLLIMIGTVSSSLIHLLDQIKKTVTVAVQYCVNLTVG